MNPEGGGVEGRDSGREVKLEGEGEGEGEMGNREVGMKWGSNRRCLWKEEIRGAELDSGDCVVV